MTDHQSKTFQITAPLVILGRGESATYLYRGGIVPAGFASDEQIEHHLAIKAIKELELTPTEVEDETEGGISPELKARELDGRPFTAWRVGELRELAKTEEVDLGGKSAKGDLYAAILTKRDAA